MVRIHQGALSSRYRSPDKTTSHQPRPAKCGAFCCLVTRVNSAHQSFTRTSRFLHQSCAGEFTSRAVTLKESKGQHPHSPSRASHVYQVTLHLHPFPNDRTWLTRACRIPVDRAATSGVRSNRGVGQSHQLCARPLGTLDCLMRIHHPDQTGSPPRRASLPACLLHNLPDFDEVNHFGLTEKSTSCSESISNSFLSLINST